MLGLAMDNEIRPAASFADPLLVLVPKSQWIADHNYLLWLLAYVPLNFALWAKDRRAFVHFLYLGGVLSLLRGVCILGTGFGPVEGADVNAGMPVADAVSAWWQLVNPISALTSDAPHVYLTKDMFFSGHAATTFLLFCYCWPHPRLRWLSAAAHVGIVAVVFLAHLHYTVDVVGAWAITGVVFWLGRRLLPLARFRANDVGSPVTAHAAG
jgi:hypothetical protein